MKILHIIFSLNVGGSESMLVDILNEQAKTKNQIELIIINDEYNEELLNKISKKIKISFCHRKKGSRNILPIIKLNYKLLKFEPDIIHAHDHTVIQCILPLKKWKTILTLHAIGFDVKNFTKYDCICAISKSVQKDIFDRSNLKSELVYNGINTCHITKKVNNTEKNDTFKIIQVGRLEHEIKGQDILITALSLINKKDLTNRIIIDIIGEGSSRPYLQELIKQLKLEKQVNLLGLKNRDYIYTHLHKYDLLAQPSRSEGFGLTVTEGMAAKIPVLVSNNEGPMEIINNGEYGFFFEKGNAEDCANKILEINTYKNINELTEKAYNYAYNNFDIKNTVQKYFDLYKKMLSSSNH